MQAEVAVRLNSGSPEDNAKEVSSEPAGLASKEAVDKKSKEKKLFKIDFSAYCDCV